MTDKTDDTVSDIDAVERLEQLSNDAAQINAKLVSLATATAKRLRRSLRTIADLRAAADKQRWDKP